MQWTYAVAKTSKGLNDKDLLRNLAIWTEHCNIQNKKPQVIAPDFYPPILPCFVSQFFSNLIVPWVKEPMDCKQRAFHPREQGRQNSQWGLVMISAKHKFGNQDFQSTLLLILDTESSLPQILQSLIVGNWLDLGPDIASAEIHITTCTSESCGLVSGVFFFYWI